jgi:hypothetical protein
MFIKKLLLKIKSKIKSFKDEKQLEEKKRKFIDDFSNNKIVKFFSGKTEFVNSFFKKNPVDGLEKKTEKVDNDLENLKVFVVNKVPLVDEKVDTEKRDEWGLNEAERNFVKKSVEAQQKFIDKQLKENLIQKSNTAALDAHIKILKESTARNLNQK